MNAAAAPPIRVLQLIDRLRPGGAERTLVFLAHNIDRSRVDLTFCTLIEEDGRRGDAAMTFARDLHRLGFSVDRVGARTLYDLPRFARLVRYIKRHGFEIVHTHLTHADVWGRTAAATLGLPAVSTIHSARARPGPTPRAKVRHCLARWTARWFAQKLIAVSQAAEAGLLAQGIAQERIALIPNGLDARLYSTDPGYCRAAVRQKLNIPVDAPLIVTVARLAPGKGHEYLLRAMPAVLAQAPDARLLLVGAGSTASHLRQVAKELGIEGRVVFAGLRRDVPDLLAASDVFVLPSLSEAQPTVLLEAMVMRVPIVATNAGGIPEIVRHGETGLLVEPASHAALSAGILTTLHERERAQRMAALGQVRVNEEYRPDVWCRKLEHLYAEICRQG